MPITGHGTRRSDGGSFIELAGARVALLPERALWWPAGDTLFVADPHWGKAATFRAAAVPVPHGTTRDDLDRLARILRRTRVRRLVVLGDWFHARSGRAQEVERALAAWRSRHADLDLLIVRGNHDRWAGDPEPSMRAGVVEEPYRLDPFVLRHYPEPSPDGYVLAGHVHPAVRLTGPAAGHLRLACFHFAPDVGVLPAFGSFTGTHTVRPRVADRVFVCAPDRVMEVEGRPRRAR